jgi:hypothetical protein
MEKSSIAVCKSSSRHKRLIPLSPFQKVAY